MKQKVILVLAVLMVSALAACSAGAATTAPAGDALAANPTTPAEYAGKTNPLAGDAAAAETGQKLFATNCASCHGPLGKGDGPAAQALNPKPKDLAAEMAQVQDGYLFWRISEGGMMAPFHSAMPAWQSILSEEQIWQIINYMHTLQP
jgi:mono/diheme cytochrome c family protein